LRPARVAPRFDEGKLLTRQDPAPGRLDGRKFIGTVGEQTKEIIADRGADAVYALEFIGVRLIDGGDVVGEVDGHDHDIRGFHQGCQEVALAGAGNDLQLECVPRALQNAPRLDDVLE